MASSIENDSKRLREKKEESGGSPQDIALYLQRFRLERLRARWLSLAAQYLSNSPWISSLIFKGKTSSDYVETCGVALNVLAAILRWTFGSWLTVSDHHDAVLEPLVDHRRMLSSKAFSVSQKKARSVP